MDDFLDVDTSKHRGQESVIENNNLAFCKAVGAAVIWMAAW